MYWVWANEPTAENEARIYAPPVEEQTGVDFESGLSIPDDLPLIEIVRGEQSQGVLPDNIIMRGEGGLLFSSRLRQVLSAITPGNIQYCPALIRNLVDGTETSDYQVANIVGRVSCLDREASVLQMAPDDDDLIEFIEVLAIDEAKANGFDLFRLSEDLQIILASDRVKEACTRHHITGVRFYKPAEYEF